MNAPIKMLVINPGSTSTKVSYFEGEKNIYTESIFHDAPELLKYPTTNDQMPMRKQVLLTFLQSHGMTPADMDVFIGRGGCAYSQAAGVMEIDERLVQDTAADKGGSDHPAKLGVMLAYELGCEYHKPMYTVNPTNVDELWDCARLTGIAGLYRRAQTHVLNQKGIAAIHAKKLGKRYEDLNLIVCHVDGGITVTAHKAGRMVDSTEGAGGDGPFTPTRLGLHPGDGGAAISGRGTHHRPDALHALPFRRLRQPLRNLRRGQSPRAGRCRGQKGRDCLECHDLPAVQVHRLHGGGAGRQGGRHSAHRRPDALRRHSEGRRAALRLDRAHHRLPRRVRAGSHGGCRSGGAPGSASGKPLHRRPWFFRASNGTNNNFPPSKRRPLCLNLPNTHWKTP